MRRWTTALGLLLTACPVATDTDAPTDDTGGSALCGPDLDPADGLVRTAAGWVQGTAVGDGVTRWLGVPFAAPPLGDLRLRAPRAAPCRTATLQADTWAPLCPQWRDGEQVGVEDCLQLNVWAPADADGAPVVVFVPGGGHELGGASVEAGGVRIYDGTRLAERLGAVVVVPNYRLGPLGFLAHPDLTDEGGDAFTNHGMHDQIAALRWVQDEIAGFGGDPTKVMVTGESAGGVSVCRLLASPLTDGLFAAAGIQSGGCQARSLADAEDVGRDIVDATRCATADDVPTCLREEATVEELLDAFSPLEDAFAELGAGTWTGVVDGVAVPAVPQQRLEDGQGQDVPVIIGSNRDEAGSSPPFVLTEPQYEQLVRASMAGLGLGTALADRVLEAYPASDYDSPRDAWVALASDVKFTCPALGAASALAEGLSSPVRTYFFEQVPENAPLLVRAQGAFHGAELFYLFGTLEDAYRAGDDDAAVIEAMQASWVALAAGDDPRPGDAAWPAWDGTRTLRLGPTLGVDDHPRAEVCALWKNPFAAR